MKTIFNSLIALLVLFMNSESFAYSKSGNDEKNAKSVSYVPVSPRDWSSNASEAPEFLKFVKAKTALVRVAEFVWGNPDEEVPVELKPELSRVPIPNIIRSESLTETPESLRQVKAKYAKVPVPTRNWEDVDISAAEISLLR